MSISEITSYKVQELKRRLNIETTLAIHYTTYESGSNKVIEKGWIHQDACGDIKKEIITLVTGSNHAITWIRLIYKEWPSQEPTIKRIRYESSK